MDPISLEQRLALIQNHPLLQPMSKEALREEVWAEIARHLTPQQLQPGDGIFIHDQLFWILSGTGWLSTRWSGRELAVKTGDWVGIESLLPDLSPDPEAYLKAEATVTLLTLPAKQLAERVDLTPLLPRIRLQVVGTFLKQATVFSALDSSQLRQLAERITLVKIDQGEFVFRHSDPGEDCYLIWSGEVEVLSAKDPAQVVGRLGAGMLFGEAALLTALSRTASIRAAIDVELFKLNSMDFLTVIGNSSKVKMQVARLLQERGLL